jgi:hypothetical protein
MTVTSGRGSGARPGNRTVRLRSTNVTVISPTANGGSGTAAAGLSGDRGAVRDAVTATDVAGAGLS